MSTAPENQDPKETSTSEESQTSKEDTTEKSTESAATTNTDSKVAVSEELMAKIVDLCAKNSEAAINLQTRISTLQSKLDEINKEIESRKPLEIKAQVTGVYNFEKRQKEILDEYHVNQKEHARKLFDKANALYPSA